MKCICFTEAQLGTLQADAAGSAMLDCAIKHPLAQKQAVLLDLASSEHVLTSHSLPCSYVGQRRGATMLLFLCLQWFSRRNNWEIQEREGSSTFCIPSLLIPHVLLVPKLNCQQSWVWRVSCLLKGHWGVLGLPAAPALLQRAVKWYDLHSG